MSAQLSLLDLFPTPAPTCHDCGRELTDKEALIPATCWRGLTCTHCCLDCHHKALGEIMAFVAKNRRWPNLGGDRRG